MLHYLYLQFTLYFLFTQITCTGKTEITNSNLAKEMCDYVLHALIYETGPLLKKVLCLFHYFVIYITPDLYNPQTEI